MAHHFKSASVLCSWHACLPGLGLAQPMCAGACVTCLLQQPLPEHFMPSASPRVRRPMDCHSCPGAHAAGALEGPALQLQALATVRRAHGSCSVDWVCILSHGQAESSGRDGYVRSYSLPGAGPGAQVLYATSSHFSPGCCMHACCCCPLPVLWVAQPRHKGL